LYYKATFTGPDGEVAGLIGTIIDITERKQSENRQAMEHAITRMLAATADAASTIPQVIRILCEALGWKGGALWRREAQRREPVFVASWGSAPARIDRPVSVVRWQADGGGMVSVPLLLGSDALGAMVFAGAPQAPDRELTAM